MRVVHVSAESDPLGRAPDALLDDWATLPDVASAVARAGADVTVVLAAAHDAGLERGGARYRFVRVPARVGLRKRFANWATPLGRRWVEAVAQAKPDVIHFNGLGFPRHLHALARALPAVPILVQDHADGVPGRWTRRMHARGLARAAGVSFTAPELAERFVRAGVIPRSTPLFAIPEQSSHFQSGDQARARADSGLYGDPCLLSVAHLDANKDPLTVLGAVARVARELPDVRLWCVFRDESLRGAMQARIAADARLEGRVHFLGAQPRARVETLLRAADLFVQGSHRESTGYTLIEALACGLTPLVTRIPSFRAVTRDGLVGGLFEPGDDAALAALFLDFARRDRAQLRAAARRHFEQTLSFDVLGRSLVDAYRALLDARA